MTTQPLNGYDRVRRARQAGRSGIDRFIAALFDEFTELKGDRLSADDPAMYGGIAFFHGMPVTVIGHRKGRTAEENLARNFGMPGPAGYRKALRLIRQAEKFHRPVISFIDSPGAWPGPEAEAGGQAAAIAECLAAMGALKTPVIAVVTGEGESGGALAIAVADRVYMLENAVYGLLSPEAFASVMWKDPGRAAEAGDLMRLTARELLEDQLIDGIIPEEDLPGSLDRVLREALEQLTREDPELLPARRYLKYRKMDGLYGQSRRRGPEAPRAGGEEAEKQA